MMHKNTPIGIIGGSGLYEMADLKDIQQVALDTPFGQPSDDYIIGELKGVRVAFLPRHGRGHRLSPAELNFRANIYGFKKLGVERLIAVTAVGSLKEHIRPLDIVIPDQFYDCTKQRVSTFFGNGLVAHIAFADPVCPHLTQLIYGCAKKLGAAVHMGGTLLCIDGPAFSTRAESHVYRQWGMDIIGMTSLQEAKLAREAEICYAAVAMVTDFDCWHPDHDAVTVQDIIKVLMDNAERSKRLVMRLAADFPREHEACPIGSDRALDTALITAPTARDPALLAKLDAVAGRVLGTD
jgi:5'-methylthioadenosine phosphorylase